MSSRSELDIRPDQPPAHEPGSSVTDIRTPRRISKLGIAYPLPLDAQRRVSKMASLARDAETCFPDVAQAIPMVKNSNRRFTHGPEHLQEHGVEVDEIRELFSERRGTWSYTDDSEVDIYSMRPGDVLLHVRDVLEPINKLVDRSLDGLSVDGFNKHSELHTGRVTKTGLRLLEYATASDDQKRNFIVASEGHDIGNLFDREAHPIISARMLRRIFPGITEDRDAWDIINRAIVLHDSDNLQAVMSIWGKIPAQERVQRLAEFLGEEGLALLIGDKVDIGIDRISDKPLPSAVLRDPHLAVNLLGSHNSIEPYGNSIIWILKYSKTFTPNQRRKLSHIIEGVEQRMESGELKATFEEWDRQFVRIYADRMVTTVEAAMGFFPGISKVEINMQDHDGGAERRRVFHRDSLDDDINKLKEEQALSRKKRF